MYLFREAKLLFSFSHLLECDPNSFSLFLKWGRKEDWRNLVVILLFLEQFTFSLSPLLLSLTQGKIIFLYKDTFAKQHVNEFGDLPLQDLTEAEFI